MAVSFIRIIFSRSFLHISIILLGSLSLGIAIAFPSPTLTSISQFFSFSTTESGLFNAITSLTAVAGPFVTNLFLNTRGRRFTIQVTALLCALSWIVFLIISENQKYVAVFCRALLGIAAGGFSAVNPVYIMELSPPEYRSIYGSMHQFGITVGIFLINLLGIYFEWRALSAISLIICLLLCVFIFIVPESPVFLKAFKNTFGTGSSQSSTDDHHNQDSILSSRYRGALILGVMMMFFQQFSGINAVLSNLGRIVVSKSGPACAASSQCFSCLLCISIIEKLGRNKTWQISLFGAAASMFVLALDNKYEIPLLRTVNQDGVPQSTISMLAAFSFLFFFCFGLGPIPWFFCPENFPDRVRGLAMSILSALNWILSFCIILIYPIMTSSLGMPMTLMIFGGILISGGVYGMKMIKESPASTPADEIPSFADVQVEL